MKHSNFTFKPIIAAFFAAGLMSACGGGGSSNNQPTSGGDNTNPSGGTSANTVMACADGTAFQCSGENRVSNGEVALTDFGVQAYGRSASDDGKTTFTSEEASNATGFELASGGTTEVRLGRAADGSISRVAVLLDNLGISWNGVKDRPKIIEGFDPTQGRVTVVGGALKFDNALPPSSNTDFYDFAKLGPNATQSNYAYNRYFPRDAAARCLDNTSSWCGGKETDGLQFTKGDGGINPDIVNATRYHEDGDVHAGDALDGSVLSGGSGHGVPFAGSKGFRTYTGMSYTYVNLGAWMSADTVQIAEWTAQAGNQEHSTNRRGVVAFGALTNPAIIPTTGNATYTGKIYGQYVANKDADPTAFGGTASITVNFAAHTATIEITSDNNAIPVGFKASTTIGAGSGNLANALSGGAVSNSGTLNGTITGRYFGPIVPAGSGQGPAETGGAFALKSASGEAVIGGFIARKQ